MHYPERISLELSIRPEQVTAAIGLFDAENTIPFVARYRKEVTGGLDEEQLRQIDTWLGRLRSLDERRAVIFKSIEEQGKLTAELRLQIEAAGTLTELEDLYQPYKPKRRTRASMARERGLEPLAQLIIDQNLDERSLESLALPYLSDEVKTTEDVWQGARDIVAEMISDHAGVRQITRAKALQWGSLICEKVDSAEDPQRQFELYYEFDLRVDRLRPHQILAINRGEHEKIMRVRIMVPERDWREAIATHFTIKSRSLFAEQFRLAMEDAAERLLLPAIERDVRRSLTEAAENHAIQVFADNLRALLSQPPLAGHTILGIDPGFRTGCKLSVVDPTGKVLATGTIYPHEPQKRWEAARHNLGELVSKWGVTLIAIGNGTASRETEQLVADFLHDFPETRYLIVNEAGASVYSASPLAREELPTLDVSLRGAVSIARRVQDPLAELVKIDPKSIGVGMYQHDVDQKALAQALLGVVESVVNQVGVDANTASPALLTYVAGIGPKLAARIVAHRDEHGPFSRRDQFTAVSGFGPKAFEQAAGFLRIRAGENLLDASAIHPESYPAATELISRTGIDLDTPAAERQRRLDDFLVEISLSDLAVNLGIGLPTLEDICEQLLRPGRDPRADLPAPILRSDVLKMEDLSPGMTLQGTVRNVVDFGAFIDIGVKQDGLLHRSEIPRGVVLHVGDVIRVRIKQVDEARGRIGLAWSE